MNYPRRVDNIERTVDEAMGLEDQSEHSDMLHHAAYEVLSLIEDGEDYAVVQQLATTVLSEQYRLG